MNDYISSGLDKDLVDPDGGVNAEKKKAELGLLSKNKDNVLLELKQFPDKGFEVGLSRIPTIGYSQIVTCIRPVLEYACLVFHHSLPQYLSNEMERLQKSALRIMQPDLSYAEALVALDITSLYERRKALSNALFDQIVRDQSHNLHDLLPPRNESIYCTRSQRYFKLPICKTNMFKNTFIMANSFNY